MSSSLRFIPNALCILRMLLVVPVAWLLANHEFRLTLWLFAFAAATDGLDGFLAKRCGWTTELGKILDPLADKILLVGVFLTLAIMGLVPLWLAITAIVASAMWTLPGVDEQPVAAIGAHAFHIVAGFLLAALLIVSGLLFGPQAEPDTIDDV